jgi:hypothetical protein
MYMGELHGGLARRRSTCREATWKKEFKGHLNKRWGGITGIAWCAAVRVSLSDLMDMRLSGGPAYDLPDPVIDIQDCSVGTFYSTS